MHSSSFGTEVNYYSKDVERVYVAIATLVIEGRIPTKGNCSKAKKFYEGPHCTLLTGSNKEHKCDKSNKLCQNFDNYGNTILDLYSKNIPLCIDVLFACPCKKFTNTDSDNLDNAVLLEQWHFTVNHKSNQSTSPFSLNQLISAVRSQLYFSQITAWLTLSDHNAISISQNNIRYRLVPSTNSLASSKFTANATRHEFPATDIGDGHTLRVSFSSPPRTQATPPSRCASCIVDDRMHTPCTLKGKHRCEEYEDAVTTPNKSVANKRVCHNSTPSTSVKDKGQLLLEAIERTGQTTKKNVQKSSECDSNKCDTSDNMLRIKDKNSFNLYIDKYCDSPIPLRQKKMRDISNVDLNVQRINRAKQKITFEDLDEKNTNSGTTVVPSLTEQAAFRKNLDSAASMVFHARTGLPLTSSPAPVRKGKTRFEYDSSLNSVSAIKRALFSNSFSTDDESESEGSIVSPCSPDIYVGDKKDILPVKYRRKGRAANLLGSFEESVLNGRLEPVSTVHGFKAELGASGSFVPKHLFVPVTVFFYTFGDNDKVSSPYLGHINLGKKGYNVPKSGTVQVTLFNPIGTVVKMFVIMYDLSDMPPNSQTFIRQRTLYMPTNCQDKNLEWGPKWLRYLIHLRFMSSKSGKIYLHSDIRMIISRKCDLDTATAHGMDMSYELRSFTHMPTNPQFSPRK